MENLQHVYEKRMDWYHEARFGMFIHWGLYSLLERGEWVMWNERIMPDDYASLAARFDASSFDPDSWADLAVEAGMKYMVLTTRHHDGFCLFDSKFGNMTSVNSAAKRDLVAEYVEAARKRNLRVGFYYSLVDMRFCPWPVAPNVRCESVMPVERREQWLDQAFGQVEELLTNYGKIDVIWFDGDWVPDKYKGDVAQFWNTPELVKMIRGLQPNIVISSSEGVQGDFDIREGHIKPSEPGRCWETCLTISEGSWGYFNQVTRWKSVPDLLFYLLQAAAGAGNLLLNVGPKADGTIREEERSRLIEIGRWLSTHGEMVYGSRRAPLANWHLNGPITAKNEKIYCCMFCFPSPESTLPHFEGMRIKTAKLMETGQTLTIEDQGYREVVKGFPAAAPDPYCSVLELEVESS